METLKTLSDHSKERQLTLCLVISLVFLFSISLNIGDINLNIINGLNNIVNGIYSIDSLVIYEIRLPRTLLALIIGASLGISGAALQGMLRNPLAEPGVIGVSASAALGAVLVFYFGLSNAFPLALPLGGITGALLAVVLLYLLAGKNSSILTLILAGVAISSLEAA